MPVINNGQGRVCMDRRKFMTGCLGLPLLAQAGGVQAQAGLTKIIFPFAAGAGGDTLCRLIAQEIAPVLQRTIVVENRTGGDGLIGIKAVKGAPADGSMVLVTTGSRRMSRR
jgi:tripartite-type tricarboxylate transporter receptor subunit TctC